MTAYALYVIDLEKVTTPEQHTAATRRTPDMYFDKLKQAEEHYGINLRRERGGFSGVKGNTEYIAFKISM